MAEVDKKSYDDGFRAKCEELGVDPDSLLSGVEKSAQNAMTGDFGYFPPPGYTHSTDQLGAHKYTPQEQKTLQSDTRDFNARLRASREEARRRMGRGVPKPVAPVAPAAPGTPATRPRNRDMLRWLDQSGGFMNDLGGNIWNQGRNIGRGIENIGIGLSDWWGGGGGPKNEYIGWGQDPERMKPRTYLGKPVRAETWDKWTPERKLRAAQAGAQLPSQKELNKIRSAKADKADAKADLPREVAINRSIGSLAAPWEYF